MAQGCARAGMKDWSVIQYLKCPISGGYGTTLLTSNAGVQALMARPIPAWGDSPRYTPDPKIKGCKPAQFFWMQLKKQSMLPALMPLILSS